MKKYIYSLTLALVTLIFSGCNDFLTLDPQGEYSTSNYYDDEGTATVAVNGIYDLLTLSGGSSPDNVWLANFFEYYFSSVISDDSEKGSKAADGATVISLLNWIYDPSFTLGTSYWKYGYWGVSRANNVIQGLSTATFDESIRDRLYGESYFMRAYFYYYVMKYFGGAVLLTEPVIEANGAKRASLHETIEFILNDLDMAIERLPKRSEYASSDLGRATKGAAQSLKARVLMYQAGVDGEATDATSIWQEIYDLTTDVIDSKEYSLMDNYAELFEVETKNSSESIFEIQTIDNSLNAGTAASTGQSYANSQANRVSNEGVFSGGWGFNNPTQNLVDAFDPTDPRLSCTVYGITFNDGILYGLEQSYDRSQMGSNYFNRKVAMKDAPSLNVCAGKNIVVIRLADVILIRSEAAYMLGNEAQAKSDLNTIRDRARNSTYCKGYTLDESLTYTPTTGTVNIPDVTATGEDLLEAIWLERRLELAMEDLRTWDLIRQGRFLETIDKVKDKDREGNGENEELQYPGCMASCMNHCLGESHGAKVPIPVITVPSSEVSAWGLEQNPY